jgi:DNA-binding transcriptional LysR family regulator
VGVVRAGHPLSKAQTVIVVGGFSSALALARSSNLIATVPERHTGNLRTGMHTFPLPPSVPEMTISLIWHPRLDADPTHRWLRRCILDACVTSLGPSGC